MTGIVIIHHRIFVYHPSFIVQAQANAISYTRIGMYVVTHQSERTATASISTRPPLGSADTCKNVQIIKN
jgi:hypothetical protein